MRGTSFSKENAPLKIARHAVVTTDEIYEFYITDDYVYDLNSKLVDVRFPFSINRKMVELVALQEEDESYSDFFNVEVAPCLTLYEWIREQLDRELWSEDHLKERESNVQYYENTCTRDSNELDQIHLN